MARAGQPTSPRTCWRDPRRDITAERRSEKLTRHRSHPMTAEYGIASFVARCEARRLNVTRADGPKPPDAAKTRGVKEAISTSRTRWSYRLFSHKRSSMATKDAKCNWMATPDRELCPCTFEPTNVTFVACNSGCLFSLFLLFFLWNAITSIVWVCLDHFRQAESRTEPMRRISSSGVSAQGRGPSMFAWKSTTKTSLAQKARAPKRSLARKEILISAVRLTVDLSPFLQLTLSYEIGSRWQRQLCLTALHICRLCSKFYTRHLHAPRPTPLSLHVKIVHKRKICKAQDWKKKRTKN